MLELGTVICLYVRTEITRYKPATKYPMISHKPEGNFKNVIASNDLS